MIFIASCCYACATAVADAVHVPRGAFRYVHEMHDLAGLRGIEILVCSRVSARPDYAELLEVLKVRELKTRLVIHHGFKPDVVASK